VKKIMELMEGCMVRSGGDEYMRGRVPFGSSLCSLIFFLSHVQITIMSFLFLFFEKHLAYLREVFNLDVFPGRLKEGFHPGIFLFFFHFFFMIGPPHEVFNPKMGLRCLMQVFT